MENNTKHPGWRERDGKNWWESRQADTRKLTTRRAIKKSVPHTRTHTHTLTHSGREIEEKKNPRGWRRPDKFIQFPPTEPELCPHITQYFPNVFIMFH